MKIALPGETAPKFVELKTADANVFRQVYVEKQYDLDSRHQQHVDGVYRASIETGKMPIIIGCGANVGASLVEPRNWLFAGAGTSKSLQKMMAVLARGLAIKG